MSDNHQQPESATVGTWVKVAGLLPGEEEVFELVPEEAADYPGNKIPPSSPLASALLGSREGDTIAFHAPAGKTELQIVEIGSSS